MPIPFSSCLCSVWFYYSLGYYINIGYYGYKKNVDVLQVIICLSMSYNYLNDTFGRSRKKNTRFSNLEDRAVGLIKDFVKRRIDSKAFAEGFNSVRIQFYEMLRAEGRITIDEDTPLWLNQFLGNHFIDWYEYQKIKWYFEAHPSELKGEYLVSFLELQKMNFDERFLQTCEAVLENKKKTNWLKLALFESYRRMKSIFYPLVQKFIMEDE